MIVSGSKGSMRLNKDAMKEWTDKFSKAEEERRKRQEEYERRQAANNGSGRSK
jgi:hypothetical protein